jgi:hypothetical protein
VSTISDFNVHNVQSSDSLCYNFTGGFDKPPPIEILPLDVLKNELKVLMIKLIEIERTKSVEALARTQSAVSGPSQPILNTNT